MERLPGTTRNNDASSLLLRLALAVRWSVFWLVEPHDELFADRMRLQDDVETFPVVVWEGGSDVEPVVILLGTLNDRVDPIHLLAFLRHDAPSFRLQGATCSVASGEQPRA